MGKRNCEQGSEEERENRGIFLLRFPSDPFFPVGSRRYKPD